MLAEYLLFMNLMFGECRGEPLVGQYRVSQVILSRHQDDWIDKGQFSCVSNWLKHSIKNKHHKKLFNNVYDNIDIGTFCFWTILYVNADLVKLLNTNNIYHFMTINAHNKMKRTSEWYKNKTKVVFITGNHVFSSKILK